MPGGPAAPPKPQSTLLLAPPVGHSARSLLPICIRVLHPRPPPTCLRTRAHTGLADFSIFFFFPLLWPGRRWATLEVADCARVPTPQHSYIFGTPPTIPPPSPPSFFPLLFPLFTLQRSKCLPLPKPSLNQVPNQPGPSRLPQNSSSPATTSPSNPPQNIAIVHPLSGQHRRRASRYKTTTSAHLQRPPWSTCRAPKTHSSSTTTSLPHYAAPDQEGRR